MKYLGVRTVATTAEYQLILKFYRSGARLDLIAAATELLIEEVKQSLRETNERKRFAPPIQSYP